MKNKILIIGGTGFIGYHLGKKCLAKGWLVSSFSTSKPKKNRKLKKVDYITGNISNKKDLKKIKGYFDYVVNLGGHVDHKNKIKTIKSHFNGCKNLANFFQKKKIKAFIQMGSSGEYGKIQSPHYEKYLGKPKSHYASSKLKATKFLIKLFRQKNFPVIILRLYQAYGPNQSINRLIPIIIYNSILDRTFPCTEGKQYRDFVYIDDVVNAIMKCFNTRKKIFGQIFNLGSGKPQKVKKIIQLISSLIKKGNPQFGKLKMRKDETLKIFPNINKIKNLLGWHPRIPFKKGLKRTLSFYKKHKENHNVL